MVAFRFDAINHEYTDLDTGEPRPHVTGMLAETGWVDDRWFTDEGRIRGTAVHKLTADYDLGALDLPTCVSRYRNYLLGHALCMAMLKPEIISVEEARMHATWKYGNRTDRVWRLAGLITITEIKSGPKPQPAKPHGSIAAPDATSHQIQTALQAIAAAEEYKLPPEHFGRFAEYLTPKGKFMLDAHTDKRDFDEAYRIIRKTC